MTKSSVSAVNHAKSDRLLGFYIDRRAYKRIMNAKHDDAVFLHLNYDKQRLPL